MRGGLALSKDRSADRFSPDAGFGFLCSHETGEALQGLCVNSVSQEHGHVLVQSDEDYQRLPIGSKVRVLPIHACMTAAAYDSYQVVETNGDIVRWQRVNGW